MRRQSDLQVTIATLILAVVATVRPVQAQNAGGDSSRPVASSEGSGIEEVVVTARRKEESLQKVGIAIDAVSAQSLTERGIDNALDLTKSVPAISFTQGGSNITSVYLRGIGNNTTSSFNDPAVTPNYDGVAIGRASGLLGAAFYDIARIEVLKGPQGILYGRNSTGGNVNIIPNKPDLERLSAGFNGSYGNFSALDLNAYVNVPVGERTAFRVAGSRQSHDGYYNDGTGDQDVSSLRGQFLFEASEDLSIRVGTDWTHLGGRGPGGAYVGQFSGPTFVYSGSGLGPDEGMESAASNAYRQTHFDGAAFTFLNPITTRQKQDSTYWGVNAEVDWKTSIGTVTIIPAYRSAKDNSTFHGPGFNTAAINEDIKQHSLEARLAGSASSVDYVVGGLYYRENQSALNEYNQEFVLPILDYDYTTKSWAGFGQLTFHAGDSLRLIGGLRYTHDDKAMDGFTIPFIALCPAQAPACVAPGAMPHFPDFLTTADTVNWLTSNGWVPPGSTVSIANGPPQVLPLITGVPGIILAAPNVVNRGGSFSRATWRAAAEYDLSPSNMLYASAEAGYRAGGYQLAAGREAYHPEYITAYTLGSKNRFFNDSLQVNLEVFYWKYRDQQATYFTVDNSGVLLNSTENVGNANLKGFDLDIEARPLANTRLGAKVQYLDAKYDSAHFITAFPRNNFGCPATLTGGVTTQGAPILDINCGGRPLLFSPEWTINLDAEQTVPLSNKLELVGGANAAYRGKQFGASEYLAFEEIPGYWLVDLNLSLRSSDKGWAVTGFVHNVADVRRNIFPQSVVGLAVAHYNPPRTYGLRVSLNY